MTIGVLTDKLGFRHISPCSYYHGNKSVHMARTQCSHDVELKSGCVPRVSPASYKDTLIGLQVQQIQE